MSVAIALEYFKLCDEVGELAEELARSKMSKEEMLFLFGHFRGVASRFHAVARIMDERLKDAEGQDQLQSATAPEGGADG